MCSTNDKSRSGENHHRTPALCCSKGDLGDWGWGWHRGSAGRGRSCGGSRCCCQSHRLGPRRHRSPRRKTFSWVSWGWGGRETHGETCGQEEERGKANRTPHKQLNSGRERRRIKPRLPRPCNQTVIATALTSQLNFFRRRQTNEQKQEKGQMRTTLPAVTPK